ncbi:MAG TPA: hypothetical protein VG406_24260 [Isosphaeraceae bacterium]|jgi:hypothetical protein|nr:hypothetical protein [Isosphaeraceae bacterium]
MGTFRTSCTITNVVHRDRSSALPELLVDTVRIDPRFTVDEVVFAEPGDLLLLGARTLDGLNLTVDARQKTLVAAGPLPAATARDAGRGWADS